MIKKFTYILLALLLAGCSAAPKKPAQAKTALPQVAFNADTAYSFVAAQVAYGPRVPGTEAHHNCVQYIGRTLERFGAEVEVQTGDVRRYDGQWQHVANICAYLPADSGYTDKPAILLCAHYDSRPWADQEEDYDRRMIPILGANDGASGVGVLMEVARQWAHMPQRKRPVRIVLFDCEDMGTPAFYTGQQYDHTWCLGAQLWSRMQTAKAQAANGQSQTANDKYAFGILLDMVGDPNATFPREYYSEQYAGKYVDRIWRTAEKLGYSHRFVSTQAYPITDDHYYVNTIAKIPCVDIVHYQPESDTGFAWWWHTRNDDMNNISPNTLQEVGRVIMTVISE